MARTKDDDDEGDSEMTLNVLFLKSRGSITSTSTINEHDRILRMLKG
jgi:hypothetical protein